MTTFFELRSDSHTLFLPVVGVCDNHCCRRADEVCVCEFLRCRRAGEVSMSKSRTQYHAMC
ncbi:hypothetical protein C8Q74DRAFT_1300693, partial [Fomes fomentarius]